MMKWMLKRVLPFVLTACLGVLIGNLVASISPGAEETIAPIGESTAEPHSYSYYSLNCHCLVWTTDEKQWVQILDLPKPSFTEEARRNRFSGGLQVRVLLGAGGEVLRAEPYGRLPYGLTEEIVGAARRIRFTPASIFYGTPESAWVTVGYTFETINQGFYDTYHTQAHVFDHYDINRHGFEQRMESPLDTRETRLYLLK